MCEYCVESESWGETLEKGATALKCEWMPDPEETLDDSMDPDDMFDPFAACERPATGASVDSTTEDHLCEQHQLDERQESEEGFDSYPCEQSVQFVSINGEAACDYLGDLLSDSVTRCGVPATHVKLMTQRTLFCEDHFPSNGELPLTVLV